MIEDFFSFTQQEFLYVIANAVAMITGVYISLKHKIQPILTLLIMLAASIVYTIITNLVNHNIQQHVSDVGLSGGTIVLLGFFGILTTLKILKKLLRIPALIIHNILSIFFMLFLFYQVNEHLINNQHFTELILSYPISDGSIPLNFTAFQQTASLFPELFVNDPFFYEVMTAILAIVAYLYFAGRFRHPGNSLSFAFLMFLALFFISLFRVNAAELPALSDRLMGLNVIQWGLVLAGILILAYIVSIELDPSRRKREILKKAPSEYRLLILYLFLTMISFQATSLFSHFDTKVLLISYFITSIIMVIYFLNKVEKNFLRYGTVSIILFTFILFMHANIAEYQRVELPSPDKINTPGIIKDQPLVSDHGLEFEGTNKTGPYTRHQNDQFDPVFLISSSYQVTTPDDRTMDKLIRSNP